MLKTSTQNRDAMAKIRKSTPKDAGPTNRLDDACFPDLMMMSSSSSSRDAYVAGQIASQRSNRMTIPVAEVRGQVVGYAWAKPLPGGEPAALLDLIAVAVEYRRQGIAQALTKEAVQGCRAMGYSLIVATVNDASLAMFIKCGWSEVPAGHRMEWTMEGGGPGYFDPDFSSGHDRICYLTLNESTPEIQYVRPQYLTPRRENTAK